jgi:hypothetical protein
MGLVTLEEAKDIATGITGNTISTLDDATLQLFIDIATTRIETYCSRNFELAEYTETHYDALDYRGRIYLKNFPVSEVSIISIKDRGVTTQYTANTENCPEYFTLRENTGELIADNVQMSDYVTVTYIAGYETGTTGDIPKDLQLACVILINTQMMSQIGIVGSLQGQNLGDYGESWRIADEKNQILPLIVRQMVSPYKSVRV